MSKETEKKSEPFGKLDIEAVVKDFEAALPQLKERQQRVLAELHKINQQIQAAETVLRAFDSQLPEEPTRARVKHVAHTKIRPRLKIKARTVITPSGRAPNKQVYDHVAQLLDDGSKYGATELRAELQKRFGIDYSIASVYRALNAGKKAGKYESRDGVWSARQK